MAVASIQLPSMSRTASRAHVRANRYDAVRIEGLDGVIPAFDVIDIHCFAYLWNLEQATQVRAQRWVVDETLQVALERPWYATSKRISVTNSRISASVKRSPTRNWRVARCGSSSSSMANTPSKASS